MLACTYLPCSWLPSTDVEGMYTIGLIVSRREHSHATSASGELVSFEAGQFCHPVETPCPALSLSVMLREGP
jgi:hypothetical protein